MFMWWKLFGIIGALIGIGGVAYGANQHQQRVSESGIFALELKKKEEEIADVEVRFGRQSEQFRIMAEEIRRYKQQNSYAV